MTGTLGAALEARGIHTAENLRAEVDGNIENIDGVLRITRIHLRYRLKVPHESKAEVHQALAEYAERCPGYQSVKGCITCDWEADLEEVKE